MIVVDASAVVAFFLREEGWENLKPYMKRGFSVDHVVKEFYNAVWKAMYLFKTLDHESMQKVLELFNSYIENNLILEPGEKYIDKALNIALKAGITIYDSLYTALALDKKTPLLTLDRKQRDTALKLGIKILP
ncbi:MAG: type II toxin-antitoxin system VapC family toxin [Desulfurococcaceae archaeon]